MGTKRKQKKPKVINSEAPVANKPSGPISTSRSRNLTTEEIELEEAVFGQAIVNKGKQKQSLFDDAIEGAEEPIHTDRAQLDLTKVDDNAVSHVSCSQKSRISRFEDADYSFGHLCYSCSSSMKAIKYLRLLTS